MSFIWTSMLWTLTAIPLLALLYLRMQRRRHQLALRYGSLGLVRQASGRSVGARRHIPAILFLVGLTVLFIALARPQMVVGLPKVEGIVILAFDVSGSMAAEDFEPNRLEAAKAVAIDFVSRQPSTVEIGVVAFSESGLSVQIPSADQAAVIEAIQRLKPERGTSLANGIVASLNTIANLTGQTPITGFEGAQVPAPLNATPEVSADQSSVIVLLTDGENNMDPDPLAAAEFAAERGVRIHTIAIGSTEGIQLTVNGFTVFTQVDEAALRQIAEITEGTYFNAQDAEDLHEIYESIEPRLRVEREETEVTAIFAGVSILLLLAGGALSLLWFSRVP
ncbi:MAG: ABC transporter ATP-binding protein [Chloroflexi bacterium]|nr:ABC transporter ATP-binding protein [Chloroflexota bacterium]MDL1944397.1 VWA domain-containing protein [Chloroflexi bacterium CFX2]